MAAIQNLGMHSTPIRLLWFAIMIVGTSTSTIAGDNEVTWLMPDYPPVTIINGPHKGTGYADIFLRYFIERTPEYKHLVESSSMSRVFGLMKQGQPVCHPSLLKTKERETYVDFSDPVEFALPHHIVIRSDRVPRLATYRKADGSVDVVRLLKDDTLVMTYQEKRGYPAMIADALKAGIGQKHIIQTSADDEGPFRQLAGGWVDYIITYPDEANWFSKILNLPETAKFAYIPIAGLPEYLFGHVGCTKGPWGRKMIERVNSVVAKAGTRPVWIDAEAQLLDPVAARRFDELFARNSPFRPQSK